MAIARPRSQRITPEERSFLDKLAGGAGTALTVLDLPRRTLFETVFGTPHGEDVTGGRISGLALDIAADPLNLLAFGPIPKALGKVGLRGRQLRKIKELRTAEKLSRLSSVEGLAAETKKLTDLMNEFGIKSGRKFTQRDVVDRLLRQAPDKPFTTRLRERFPSSKAALTFEQFAKLGRTGFIGKKFDPVQETIRTFRNIEESSGKVGVERLRKEILKDIKKVSKETGKSHGEVLDETLDIMENVHGGALRHTELAQQRLKELYKAHPFETREALAQAGRVDELKMVDEYASGLIRRGVSPIVASEYVDDFIKLGGPAKARQEIVGRAIKSEVDEFIDKAHELSRRLERDFNNPINIFARKLQETSRLQLEREIYAGIDIALLPNNIRGYVYHRITQEGRDALSVIRPDIKKLFFNTIDTRIGPSKARKGRFGKLDIAEANELAVELGMVPKGTQFFSSNIEEIFTVRELLSARGVAAAFETNALANIYATASKRGKSLEELFRRSGITQHHNLATGKTIKWGKLPKSGKKGRKLIREALEKEGLGGLRVSEEIFEDAVKAIALVKPGNPALKKILNGYDSYMGALRAWVTVPFGAYHARNSLSNWINGGVIGGTASDFRAWAVEGPKIAANIYMGKFMGKKLSTQAERMLKLGVAGRGLTYETASLLHSAPMRGVLRRTHGKMIQFGFDAGQTIEDSARIAHFLAKKRQGLSDFEALQNVNKYLFDYEHGLTAFERAVPRRLAFFYTWTRFNIPLQLETLVRPSQLYKHAMIGKLPALVPNNHTFAKTRDLDPDRPLYLLRPDTLVSPVDSDIVLNLGLPLSDLAAGVEGQGGPGIARRGIGSLSPLIKTPFELAFGKETFLGRDLEKIDRANFIGYMVDKFLPQSVSDALGIKRLKSGGFRMNPRWRKAIEVTPASRFVNLIERFFDTRLTNEQRTEALFTTFFIGSTQKLSAAKAREVKNRARRALQQGILRGEFRRGEFLFPTSREFKPQAQQIQSTLRR